MTISLMLFKLVAILTIVNSICLLAFAINRILAKIKVNAIRLHYSKKLVGFQIALSTDDSFKTICTISYCNIDKYILRDEVEYMMLLDEQSITQKLYAKMSWLKTHKELNKFAKDYAKLSRKVDLHFMVEQQKTKL